MRCRDLTELEPRTQLAKLTVNTIKKPPVYTGKGTHSGSVGAIKRAAMTEVIDGSVRLSGVV